MANPNTLLFDVLNQLSPDRPIDIRPYMESLQMDMTEASLALQRWKVDGYLEASGNFQLYGPAMAYDPTGPRAPAKWSARLASRGLELREAQRVRESQAPTTIHVNANNRSIVQVQSGSPGGAQHVEATGWIEQEKGFFQALLARKDELSKHLNQSLVAEIVRDARYAQEVLAQPKPSKSLIRTVKEELTKRLVGLPIDFLKEIGLAYMASHGLN